MDKAMKGEVELDNKNKEEVKIERRWTKVAQSVLLGKKIVKVEYLTKKECENWMWDYRPIAFQLDDGMWIIAQKDDEGNDGGVLYYTNGDNKHSDVIPVLR
jgi:hypothetical protein